MAQTQHQHREETSSFPYGDNDIVIGVSAKDSLTGVYGVLPAPALPSDLDPGLATALAVGLYYDAVRGGQSAASKAAKDGKDVAGAVREYLEGFKPSAERSVNTIAAKRVAIAKEMIIEALKSRNLATDEATVEANLPPYLSRHGERINAKLLEFLAAGYTVTKKTKSGSGAANAAAVIEDL